MENYEMLRIGLRLLCNNYEPQCLNYVGQNKLNTTKKRMKLIDMHMFPIALLLY